MIVAVVVCCKGTCWKVVFLRVWSVRQVGVCIMLLRRVCCGCGILYLMACVGRIVEELSLRGRTAGKMGRYAQVGFRVVEWRREVSVCWSIFLVCEVK